MSGEYTRALQDLHVKVDAIAQFLSNSVFTTHYTDEQLLKLIQLSWNRNTEHNIVTSNDVLKQWKEWRSSK